MPEPEEPSRFSLPRAIQSPPRAPRESLLIGGAYALEVVVCAALLRWGYAIAGAPGALWAIVSAVVVLQPGVRQSLVAASQRILANLIGASAGFGLTALLGAGPWQTSLSIVVVVTLCHALRLEQSLRTACVSVIIVTSTGDGNVGVTGLARFLAVLTGSAVALLAQWSVDATTQRWLAKFAKPRDGATSASAAPSPASAPGPKPAETE